MFRGFLTLCCSPFLPYLIYHAVARTGYVCKPPYRVMSASGDWVWIKAEAVLRYNKKTKKPTHYDMLCKVVG